MHIIASYPGADRPVIYYIKAILAGAWTAQDWQSATVNEVFDDARTIERECSA